MFVELHILQNFAPSNLNRDDTGSPKDCIFGGHRRARISSQCLKRAIRLEAHGANLIDEVNRAKRTKRLSNELVDRLKAHDKSEGDTRAVVATALRSIGLTLTSDHKTSVLLYLGNAEIKAIANLCVEYWDSLLSVAVSNSEENATKSNRGAKKASKEVASEVVDSLRRVLDGGKAADLGLFGRMIAKPADKNIDAACQVAHAISTHKVNMEFDFYTAIDDRPQPDDTSGADMLGTVEFNASCFYRYANVDLEQLVRNLNGDQELAHATLNAFVRASIAAIPTGKQNSMAAQNPPSLILVIVRNSGLWSLANAFTKPVRAQGLDGDIMAASVAALDTYWGKLVRMYGESSIVGKWVCMLDENHLDRLKSDEVQTVEELISNVLAAVSLEAATGASTGVVA